VKLSGLRRLHALFLKERRTRGPVQCSVQEIRGVSLVFREMWGTRHLLQDLVFPLLTKTEGGGY
jgi:hypothetical protein